MNARTYDPFEGFEGLRHRLQEVAAVPDDVFAAVEVSACSIADHMLPDGEPPVWGWLEEMSPGDMTLYRIGVHRMTPGTDRWWVTFSPRGGAYEIHVNGSPDVGYVADKWSTDNAWSAAILTYWLAVFAARVRDRVDAGLVDPQVLAPYVTPAASGLVGLRGGPTLDELVEGGG